MDRPKQKKVEVSTISGSSTTIEDERIREIGEQLVRYLGPEYKSNPLEVGPPLFWATSLNSY